MSWWRLLKSLVRDAVGVEPARVADTPVVSAAQTAPKPLAAAHLAAARDALRSGRLDEGAADAQAALEEDPRDLFAAFCLGQARLRQDRFPEAREAFETVARAGDPFGLAAAWLARLDEAERAADPSRPAREVSRAVEFERAARAALRHGEPQRARQEALEAIALDPDNLVAHHLLGRALLALGEREAGLAAFATARAHDTGLGVVSEWLADDLGEWPQLDRVEVDDDEEE